MVQTILRRPEVQRATGLPRSSLYALIAAGHFPEPIKLGRKSSGWLETEVIAWQQARIAERNAPKRRRKRNETQAARFLIQQFVSRPTFGRLQRCSLTGSVLVMVYKETRTLVITACPNLRIVTRPHLANKLRYLNGLIQIGPLLRIAAVISLTSRSMHYPNGVEIGQDAQHMALELRQHMLRFLHLAELRRYRQVIFRLSPLSATVRHRFQSHRDSTPGPGFTFLDATNDNVDCYCRIFRHRKDAWD
jgi:prophage regulatory protein